MFQTLRRVGEGGKLQDAAKSLHQPDVSFGCGARGRPRVWPQVPPEKPAKIPSCPWPTAVDVMCKKNSSIRNFLSNHIVTQFDSKVQGKSDAMLNLVDYVMQLKKFSEYCKFEI